MGLHDGGGSGIPRIMVFNPTIEDMNDFSKYLLYMESQGANKAGLAKIIPPKEWKPRTGGYDDDDVQNMMINYPIEQMVRGRQGLYQQYNIQRKAMNVRDFKKLAESKKYKTPPHFDYEELERKYWKNVSYSPPIYGADVPGSLYGPGHDTFNINSLNTILDMVNESYGIKIMGVNTAYLYFGMWKTTFAWHTEDMDLYSINYLHFGAPKSWYCIPPEHGRRLERLANGFFPSSYKGCNAFLRHKMTLISPQVLKQYSIPFNKITQEPGEFMITFPYGYHAGYNHGFNCAESTNFALPRWVEYGKRASRCYCRSDSVKISMEAFIKKFQPERYDQWLQGKDVGPHPEDPSHISAAPAPSDYELSVLSKVTTSKSKRHPPYKNETQSSDTEEYASGDESSAIQKLPTKAAKKCFDNCDETSEKQSTEKNGKGFLKVSPPRFKGSFKKMQEHVLTQVVSKKRKRSQTEPKVPLHLINHSYARPFDDRPSTSYCTQPSSSFNPLTWSPVTMSNLDVSQLFGRLLEEDPIASDTVTRLREQGTVGQPNSQSIQSQTELTSPPPPPLKQIMKSDPDPGQPCSSSSAPRSPPSPGNIPLPPPPPLKQQQTVSSNRFTSSTTNGWQMNTNTIPFSNGCQTEASSLYRPNNLLSGEGSDCYLVSKSEPQLGSSGLIPVKSVNSDLPFVSSLPQQLIELPLSEPHGSGKAEVCTSTEDLLVNDIIVRSRSIHIYEVIKNSGSWNAELNELMKCIPTPLHLYQYLPYNFFGERLYNSCIATIYPHCAICILLEKIDVNIEWLKGQIQIPMTSQVLIPNVAFVSKVSDQSTALEELQTSPLLICSDCKVCVHSACYGVVNMPFFGTELTWKCDRCEQKSHGIHCYLCPMRGGALKQTQDPKKWTHITCALMMPGVGFGNGVTKHPVEIKRINESLSNSSLGCIYCKSLLATNKPLAEYVNGYCIQCYKAPNCSSAFHVTCAHAAGLKFQSSDWPDPIRVYCNKCTMKSTAKKETICTKDEVEVGTTVIAKHSRLKRYYKATIDEKDVYVLHHIHFDDNSKGNVRSKDFISHDLESEFPEIGDQVTVLWDRQQLSGKYSGSHSVVSYSVMFDDYSKCKAKREDFYLLDEDLPKKVKSKMSNATDSKHSDLFTTKSKATVQMYNK